MGKIDSFEVVHYQFQGNKDIHGNVNMEKIVNSILTELEFNPFKNAEYYQEALRTLNEDGEIMLPANYPTIKSAIDSSIAAEFRKKIAKSTKTETF